MQMGEATLAWTRNKSGFVVATKPFVLTSIRFRREIKSVLLPSKRGGLRAVSPIGDLLRVHFDLGETSRLFFEA